MKIEYDKVVVKYGKDTKWVDVKDLEINNIKLSEILAHVALLEDAYTKLTEELKNAHIVKKDTEYIIEIDGKLKRVRNPILHESIKGELFQLSKWEGKLIKNKKVGIL
jgi:hypothetical protein